MSDSTEVRQDYLTLRENINSAHIATLASNSLPEASYAPCVWVDGNCYLFLSELASHTRNLSHNPAISLMLIEDEAASKNPFARRRVTLQGTVQTIARADDLFVKVLAEFRRRFGGVMNIIEPLQDFHLFQINAHGGRFIRGFGQAYELVGDKLDELKHIDPRK